MRVKIKPNQWMGEKQNKMLNDYINRRALQVYDEEATGLIRRCYKTFAVALHSKYGFGKSRLMQLMGELSDISKLRNKDDVFWKHLDDIIIDEIGLEFNRENYEELEE